jgi:hypothetical protein
MTSQDLDIIKYLKGDVVDQDQQRLTEQTLQQIEARLV